MLAATARALFQGLAGRSSLQRLARRYGMRRPASPARRFVAGQTLDEAIVAVRRLERLGQVATLDYLGERVTTFDDAETAAHRYRQMVDALAGAGVDRNVSIRPTRLGLDIDRATCLDNLRRVLDPAQRHRCFAWIDMEGSAYANETLDVFDRLWQSGYRDMGIVLQARLRRSDHDLDRINALGAPVRLVKSAYRESRRLAHHRRADVESAFLRLLERLFREGVSPAVATHDVALIERAKRMADRIGLRREAFEFQLPYGVRRDLQTALTAEGYRVRVYVPFGPEWFPYVMQRLAERPANLTAVIRSVMQEDRNRETPTP